MLRAVLVATLLVPAVGLADEEWKLVSPPNDKDLVVKSRARKGTPIKEYWVETQLAASVRDLEDVLVDAERFREFMPYVKESRFVGKPEADGSQIVYVRLDPPGVRARDYIVRSRVVRSVKDERAGAFEQVWQAIPDRFPKRHHIIRLKVNEGSWRITPLQNGRSQVVYKFAVDPGGAVPGFAADMANQSAIPNQLRAIEKEAQERAKARVR